MFVFRATSVLLGVILSVLILEILLNFCPVNEGSQLLPVNENNPIWRFQPNRSFTWSSGWNFSIVNKVHINNYGFVNDINYDKNLTTPLIAVIGDSYVEAMMVPFHETITGRLAEHLANTARVYSFARSGAPLSQYLVYANYAQTTFKVDGMIIVVVSNDFDESFQKYHYEAGHHHFVKTNNGTIVLKRRDVSISLAKKIARKSALARYIILNLGISSLPQRLKNLISTEDESKLYFANTSRETNPVRVADAKHAVDIFFDELPAKSGLDPSQILFVIDGIRPQLYSGSYADDSYAELMREYFIAAAKSGGYEIIDMQPRFIDRHKRNGKRFEYPTDGHWNGLGHMVVFEAIAESKFLTAFNKGTE